LAGSTSALYRMIVMVLPVGSGTYVPARYRYVSRFHGALVVWLDVPPKG